MDYDYKVIGARRLRKDDILILPGGDFRVDKIYDTTRWHVEAAVTNIETGETGKVSYRAGTPLDISRPRS